MRMKFPQLQNDDKEVKKLRLEKLPEGCEDIKEVLYYQGLLYTSKVICSDIINKYHKDPLTSHFGIEKTQKLIARKYY